jgi:putative membrane protein
MHETNHPSHPRPHRPGDPLADLAQIEAAKLDNVPVHDFIPARARLTPPADFPVIPVERRSRLGLIRTLLLIASLLALMLSLCTIEALEFVQQTEAALPDAGWIVAGILLMCFALLVWTIADAVLEYVRVRGNLARPPVDVLSLQHDTGVDWATLRAIRLQLERELSLLGAGLEAVYLQQLHAIRAELGNWPADNTRQWLLRYDGELLAIIDEAVAECIRKEAGSIALLTALSPRGGLDSLLVAWRQFRLIRSVAVLYGWRPGFFGTMALVREVFTNAVLAAGFDEVGDLAAEVLGGSLSMYTGRITGEAIGNMALTLRLARRTVDACRPLKNRAAAPYHVTFSQFAGKVPHLFKLLWSSKSAPAQPS